MKNKLRFTLIVCAALVATTSANAAPKNSNHQAAQIRNLCQNKTTRILMIREVMNTKEGRQEMAEMLGHDDGGGVRSYYETHTVNPG